jgi:hypothetical protein
MTRDRCGFGADSLGDFAEIVDTKTLIDGVGEVFLLAIAISSGFVRSKEMQV